MAQALTATPAVPSVERTSPDDVVASFLSSLDSAQHQTAPFDYWLLEDPLPAGYCEAIAALPYDPPRDTVFNGRRETNNETRVLFTPQTQMKFPVCQRIVAGLKDAAVSQAIEQATGTDLSDGHLRIEYCQDTEGFWLEPHTDIFVKKFTMLVYLSDEPGLAQAGTNIFEGPPEHKYVGSAPYGKNKGVIFIPAENTWHGMGQHDFTGLRKSIIINFVTSDWQEKEQLA